VNDGPEYVTVIASRGTKAVPPRGRTSGPIPVALVVVTAYRRGARWRPRPIRPGATALALIDNTVAVRQRPRDTIGIVKRVVAGAQGIRSPRGDAAAVAPRLLRYLDRRPAG
jgi:hypothetical protein